MTSPLTTSPRRLILSAICALSVIKAVAADYTLSTTDFPTVGEVRFLVVLAEFTDKHFSTPDARNYFTRWCNAENFAEDGAAGSIRQYFIDQSWGQFTPAFDVVGPIELPHCYKYYGANTYDGSDTNVHQLPIDLCNALDSEIDFRKYDADSDLRIDHLIIIYAGLPESSPDGEADMIWPRPDNLTSQFPDITYSYDGRRLDRYYLTSEYQDRGVTTGIGPTAAELARSFGLTYLYNYSDPFADYTPGPWSLLDSGCYNSGSRRPLGMGLFERLAFGWIEPTELRSSAEVTLMPLDSGDGIVIPCAEPNEIYLLENRRVRGWDTDIPAEGMLIWHITFDREAWLGDTANGSPDRQLVDLIEADGIPGPGSLGSDPYPGTEGITSVKAGPMTLTNIRNCQDGSISFTAKGNAAIGGVEADADDSNSRWFDITGRQVNDGSTLSPGIYLIRSSHTTTKVIVK